VARASPKVVQGELELVERRAEAAAEGEDSVVKALETDFASETDLWDFPAMAEEGDASSVVTVVNHLAIAVVSSTKPKHVAS
jgi:hypothetical protein